MPIGVGGWREVRVHVAYLAQESGQAAFEGSGGLRLSYKVM